MNPGDTVNVLLVATFFRFVMCHCTPHSFGNMLGPIKQLHTPCFGVPSNNWEEGRRDRYFEFRRIKLFLFLH